MDENEFSVQFHRLVQNCPLSLQEIADKLGVRKLLVERWLTGKALPPVSIRKDVLRVMKG